MSTSIKAGKKNKLQSASADANLSGIDASLGKVHLVHNDCTSVSSDFDAEGRQRCSNSIVKTPLAKSKQLWETANRHRQIASIVRRIIDPALRDFHLTPNFLKSVFMQVNENLFPDKNFPVSMDWIRNEMINNFEDQHFQKGKVPAKVEMLVIDNSDPHFQLTKKMLVYIVSFDDGTPILRMTEYREECLMFSYEEDSAPEREIPERGISLNSCATGSSLLRLQNGNGKFDLIDFVMNGSNDSLSDIESMLNEEETKRQNSDNSEQNSFHEVISTDRGDQKSISNVIVIDREDMKGTLMEEGERKVILMDDENKITFMDEDVNELAFIDEDDKNHIIDEDNEIIIIDEDGGDTVSVIVKDTEMRHLMNKHIPEIITISDSDSE